MQSTVYITSHNGTLNNNSEVLFYKDYKGNVVKLLPDKVKEIVLIGRTTITSGAFSLLFRNQINVVFLSSIGRYMSRLVYHERKNTLLRHQQHLVCANEVQSLSIAKDIVRGKLHNQYLYLQRIARKTEDQDGRIGRAIEDLSFVRRQLELSNKKDEFLGLEGDGSRIYFSCLGENISCAWTKFEKRSRKPPLDPVNAVLSLLYTILTNKISGYLHASGLDPGIGSLHAISYGRESLACDLVEEFRTPIVDTLTCSLFNMGVLKKEHFREADYNNPEEQSSKGTKLAILLTDDGYKKTLAQFERKLLEKHFYPLNGKVLSYDEILQEQIKQYKKVISGTEEHYKPLIVT